ncbi:hypothetical protein HY212_06120 [Candidatus Pacearchaeota archaeon]|nr:hypothetical protein [Candidatus Pacearchaeota archaeon]
MDISPKKQKISPNWKARCPFHTERTPSFVIRPGRNCYQCYGCGNSGGPFILLFQISSLPITYLETRFGLNLKAGEDKKTLRILFENELTSNRGGTNSPYRRNIPIDLYIESFLNNP